MKAIDHPTAQRWIHARLDGALDAAAAARLDAHLQDCAGCRRYAAETLALNVELRRQFHARPPSTARLSAPAVEAIHQRVAASRAKMKRFPFLNLPEAAAVALLFVLLAGGLLLALASPELRTSLIPLTRIEATQTPAITPTPTLPPTPTPLPWTEDAPTTDLAEINAALQELAQVGYNHLTAPGWLYSLTYDAGKPATIYTYTNEVWRHSPETDHPDACPEMLALVREAPHSGAILQLQGSLADGTTGDLIALRKGEGEVGRITGCAPRPETTTAGFLARRISGDPSAVYKGSAGEQIETARAWYESLDGKTLLVVATRFDTPNNLTPKTQETYWFDRELGLEVKRHTVMLQADGSAAGETLTLTEYQHMTLPPPGVPVDDWLAELRALAASPMAAAATATPPPADVQAALQDLAYTQEAPLTDGQKILAVLGALRQRQVESMANPGWYQYGPRTPAEGEISNRYNLLHVLEDGQCELFNYYLQLPDQRIASNEIILADGATGQGDIREAVIDIAEAGMAPCSPALVDSLMLLDSEILYFKDLITAQVNAEAAYQAWVETIEGREVFVLYYDLHYLDPKPNTMDPDTRAFELEDRGQEWKYFDLQSGISLGSYYVIMLENGKVLGAPPAPDAAPLYELKSMPTPPDALLQAFEKARQELNALLGR